MANEIGFEYHKLSAAEIIVALLNSIKPGEEKEIWDMCGEQGELLPPSFIKFASILYSRGFDHGTHHGRCIGYRDCQKQMREKEKNRD